MVVLCVAAPALLSLLQLQSRPRPTNGTKLYHSGVPLLGEVQSAMQQAEWKSMQAWSNMWLHKHAKVLRGKYPWVVDSFHWWSRVWEYPWTFSQLQRVIRAGDRVLDLGSGVSFFPYYVKHHLQVDLLASDYDRRLPRIYAEINSKSDTTVRMTTADARSAISDDFSDGRYDVIYSVSVLEHTDSYENVVANVQRLLKPGGYFVMTIDVSREQGRSIPVEKAVQLVQHIGTVMHEITPRPLDFVDPGALTPEYVYEDTSRKSWVPSSWRRPGPKMTVSCHTFRKPMSRARARSSVAAVR